MFDSIIPLNPSTFFAFAFPMHHVKRRQLAKEHRLPRLDEWQGREGFADLFAGWHADGLALKVVFPSASLLKESTLELLVDTRDVKTASTLHRFCHHFSFNPDEGEEITRFRSEDAHPLCDPTLLEVKAKGKELILWIPEKALVGYDPSAFDRLGLAYRLHRKEGEPQDLPLSSEDVMLEKHPGRWATCNLLQE